MLLRSRGPRGGTEGPWMSAHLRGRGPRGATRRWLCGPGTRGTPPGDGAAEARWSPRRWGPSPEGEDGFTLPLGPHSPYLGARYPVSTAHWVLQSSLPGVAGAQPRAIEGTSSIHFHGGTGDRPGVSVDPPTGAGCAWGVPPRAMPSGAAHPAPRCPQSRWSSPSLAGTEVTHPTGGWEPGPLPGGSAGDPQDGRMDRTLGVSPRAQVMGTGL